MAIVYDDILETITFRQMDTASYENLERLLHIYFNDHNLYPSREELRLAVMRYRIFGRKIFSAYRIYLTGTYARGHKWFLIEVANNRITDFAPIEHIFKDMLSNENIDWQKVYTYYDMIGHDMFYDLTHYLEKYRDELLPLQYDII